MSEDMKVYTDTEIEIFLSGERKDIDRLLLRSLNNLQAALIPHMAREDIRGNIIGTPDEMRVRVEWVDAQIARQQARTQMMERVGQSALSWAAIAFLGFVAYVFKDFFMTALHK